MSQEINRVCPFCGEKLTSDCYRVGKAPVQSIVYCDKCNQFCTNSTSGTAVLKELECIKN